MKRRLLTETGQELAQAFRESTMREILAHCNYSAFRLWSTAGGCSNEADAIPYEIDAERFENLASAIRQVLP